MATKPKTEEPTEIKAPAELTAEEIKMLYQLATQATIPVREIAKVYQLIQHVEHYLSANLDK
jgi:hypothetical protein